MLGRTEHSALIYHFKRTGPYQDKTLLRCKEGRSRWWLLAVDVKYTRSMYVVQLVGQHRGLKLFVRKYEIPDLSHDSPVSSAFVEDKS
jgi:hypothetical protein